MQSFTSQKTSLSFDDKDTEFLLERDYKPVTIDKIIFSYLVELNKAGLVHISPKKDFTGVIAGKGLPTMFIFRTVNSRELNQLLGQYWQRINFADLFIIPIVKNKQIGLCIIDKSKNRASFYDLAPTPTESGITGFFTSLFSKFGKEIEHKSALYDSEFQTILKSHIKDIQFEESILPYDRAFQALDRAALVADHIIQVINVSAKRQETINQKKSLETIREEHEVLVHQFNESIVKTEKPIEPKKNQKPTLVDDSSLEKRQTYRPTRAKNITERSKMSENMHLHFKQNKHRFSGKSPEQAQVKVEHHLKRYGKD